MSFYEIVGLLCTLICFGQVIWWVADKVPIVPGPMGQRFTLIYMWGFYAGRLR